MMKIKPDNTKEGRNLGEKIIQFEYFGGGSCGYAALLAHPGWR